MSLAYQTLLGLEQNNNISVKPLYSSKNDEGDLENIKNFNNPSELENYIKNGNCCYEYLNPDFSPYIKVFFDIDMKIDDSIEFEEQDIEKSLFLVLTSFIEAVNQKTKIFKRFNELKIRGPLAVNSKLINHIFADLAYTKSTDPKKLSIHAFFTTLYTDVQTLIEIAPYYSKYIKTNFMIEREHQITPFQKKFLESVDTVVWKNGMNLRCPYSPKENGSDNYIHIPILKSFKDNLFTWRDQIDQVYMFTHNGSISNNSFLEADFGFESKSEFSEAAIDKLNSLFNYQIVNTNDLKFYNEVYENIIVDYSTSRCNLCQKSMHKNSHKAVLRDSILYITKNGNPNNCTKIKIEISSLTLMEISEKIVQFDEIARVDFETFITWNGFKWGFEKAKYKLTSYILSVSNRFPRQYKEIFDDPPTRSNIEKNIVDILGNRPFKKIDRIPTVMFFNNGVYNFVEDRFLQGKEAKAYVSLFTTGYDYDTNWENNEKIKTAYADLQTIFDSIQPLTEENMENRINYEIVCASALLGLNKEFIIFLWGETMAGKSTTKRILQAAIGDFLIDTSSSVLLDQIDTKGPNPFLANINYRRVVFASELPDTSTGVRKIKAVNVKKLTDANIVGRQCYSNIISQTNYATFLVDTNCQPYFDCLDLAVIRRCILINFDSYFTDDIERSSYTHKEKKKFLLRNDLKVLFETTEYKMAAFLILKNWLRKHYFNSENKFIIPLKATPDKFKDFEFQRKISNYIVNNTDIDISMFNSGDTEEMYCYQNNLPHIKVDTFKTIISKYFNPRTFLKDIDNIIESNLVYIDDEECLQIVMKEHMYNRNSSLIISNSSFSSDIVFVND